MKPWLVACALVVSLMMAGPVWSQTPGTEADQEVGAVLNLYLDDFGHKDLPGTMGTFADRPTTVLLGTGPGERWEGLKEIQEAHEAFFSNFDQEEYKITWLSIDTQGNTGWFAAMIYVTAYLKNEKQEFSLNWSGVLNKEQGQWKFVMVHFSNLTGDE